MPLIATIVSNSSIIYFFIEKQRQGSLGPDGISAPFSDLWTLKFQAQPTNAFFVTINQMLGSSFQLPTSAIHGFVVWTMLKDRALGRSLKLGRATEDLIDGSGWDLNFRLRMLLKSAVTIATLLCVTLLKLLIGIVRSIFRSLRDTFFLSHSFTL